MAKNIFIDKNGGNYIAALAEGARLLEYYIEREDSSDIVGNIYKGRVVSVLPGMQAAFVDIGGKKNAYLSVNDFPDDRNDLAAEQTSIEISEGNDILVQIVKDGTGTKSVKCSPHLSFAGTYLVYMPTFDGIAVSRKITDERVRVRLSDAVEKARKKAAGGFVIRTAAAGIAPKKLKEEMEELYGQYGRMMEAAGNASSPTLVHEEADLITRMLRDVYSPDIEHIYFSSGELYGLLERAGGRRNAELKKKSMLYGGPTDMFKHFGLDKEVDKLLRNRVDLESGAYLIIDKTEALTVIDVNTGKYTGVDSLEDTVFNTNMLATKEIARQVRLRNIGGIVVVDFIDMEDAEHRERVVKALEEALMTDRSKCNVLGMSGLGLVEFTRKKKRKESTSMLVQECPYCKGDGRIYSNDYVVLKLRTALLDLFGEGWASAIVDINADMAEYIFKRGALSSDVSRIWHDKRIYIIPHRTYHHEVFRIRGDNARTLDLPDKARLLF